MFSYPKAAMERAMKVQEVILRAMAKKSSLAGFLLAAPVRTCGMLCRKVPDLNYRHKGNYPSVSCVP